MKWIKQNWFKVAIIILFALLLYILSDLKVQVYISDSPNFKADTARERILERR